MINILIPLFFIIIIFVAIIEMQWGEKYNREMVAKECRLNVTLTNTRRCIGVTSSIFLPDGVYENYRLTREVNGETGTFLVPTFPGARYGVYFVHLDDIPEDQRNDEYFLVEKGIFYESFRDLKNSESAR